MDTGNTISNEIADEFKLTEEKIRAHYKHMCEAGYDPLLCINRSFRFITNLAAAQRGARVEFGTRDKTEFVDRVITEDRYVDLLKFGEVTDVAKLDDIIFIPLNSVVPPGNQACVGGNAAIFWLRPSGCRTLGQLFTKYSKKIKDELQHAIIT